MKLRALLLAATLGLAALSAHAGPTGSAGPLPGSLQDAERELADLDRRLGDASARAGKLTADIAVRERRALARARTYARLARAGLLPVAGGFDAFVAHAMKLEGARRAITTDLATLKQLRAEHSAVVGAHDTIASRRSLVAAQREALSRAQSLIDEADERRRAFERAFSASGPPTEHVAVYGAGATVRDAVPPTSAGFSASRGRLPFPIPGRTELRSARRPSASGPGLELLAPAGTAVRAVFAGRVAFVGRYADYGRLVILDHGDRYFTVYGSLGQVDVKAGDELASGGRLGTIDEGSPAALYFEVRQGSDTLDPRPWLGL